MSINLVGDVLSYRPVLLNNCSYWAEYRKICPIAGLDVRKVNYKVF